MSPKTRRDDLRQRLDELEGRLKHLEDAVDTDLEEREYKQLSRKDKARAIQEHLVDVAGAANDVLGAP
ncbi:MAG: hypothetical protein ACI9YT_002428 [Halobacteriales archaeon]|jgi:hypothetical protein